MKRPIQVGDRVAVYGASQTGAWDRARFVGTVIAEFPGSESDWVQVKDENTAADFTFHRKQLRRLTPKRDTRRRWWINVYPDDVTTHGSPGGAESAAESDRISCVEVVEVRKKKNG